MRRICLPGVGAFRACGVVALLVMASNASAQDCDGRLRRISNLDGAREANVVLVTANRKNYFAVDGVCLENVPSWLFAESQKTAIIYVRTPAEGEGDVVFLSKIARYGGSIEQDEIKVHRRGKDWKLKGEVNSGKFIDVGMEYQDSYTGLSIESWNSIYSGVEGVEDINRKIGKKFHVYWNTDGIDGEVPQSSLARRDFWIIEKKGFNKVNTRLGIHRLSAESRAESVWATPINVGSTNGAAELHIDTWSQDAGLVNHIRLRF